MKYQTKDPLPQETETNVVYVVKSKTCDAEYVGETQRALGARAKEHRDAIRLGHDSKSAIAEHVDNQDLPHVMDWEKLKILDYACRRSERKVRQAFHIHRRNPTINRDGGVERSAVWNAVL